VYCVGILDFTFNDKAEPAGEVVHTIKLKNQRNEIFYDKLAYIYLEMPNFTKSETELESRLDMWLYFLKHLEDFQEIPRIFGSEELFTAAFAKAALAGMDREEHDSYENSLKIYRDLKGVIDTARDEGILEGIGIGEARGEARGLAKGLNEALDKMVESGMPEGDAKRILGL
jgi:PD-(D/E)XK nuclease family transposase